MQRALQVAQLPRRLARPRRRDEQRVQLLAPRLQTLRLRGRRNDVFIMWSVEWTMGNGFF